MGVLQEKYGFTMLHTKPGTCPECGVAHDPNQPHNRDSLTYMYRFFDKHGRFPSWADAMAHCSADVKAFWRAQLTARGVEVGEEPTTATMKIKVQATTAGQPPVAIVTVNREEEDS